MKDWKLIGNKQTNDYSIFEVQIEIDQSRCQSNKGVGAQCLLSTADELALQDVSLAVAYNSQVFQQDEYDADSPIFD